MIITEPNDFAAEIHDRMPVFLTEKQFAPWLSAAPVEDRQGRSKAPAVGDDRTASGASLMKRPSSFYAMYGAKLCVLGHGVEFTTSGGISFGRSRLASFVTSPKFGLMARA